MDIHDPSYRCVGRTVTTGNLIVVRQYRFQLSLVRLHSSPSLRRIFSVLLRKYNYTNHCEIRVNREEWLWFDWQTVSKQKVRTKGILFYCKWNFENINLNINQRISNCFFFSKFVTVFYLLFWNTTFR